MKPNVTSSPITSWLVLACVAAATGAAAEKAERIQQGVATASMVASSPANGHVGGGGHRMLLTNGEARVPLILVSGSPYEMGWHLGRLMKPEIAKFVPAALRGIGKKLDLNESELAAVWAATAAYTDDRLEQELLGLAAGSGLPVATLQHIHCLPLLLPYSCSSIAAWGEATADGHLYQTRDLDWDLDVGAHEFPVVVVFVPAEGTPHVIPSFAGFVGAHCGMNAAGIVLSEMGDSPAREMPYYQRAPHFTTWFRTLLYDAGSLTEALDTFRKLPMTKRYHFVFGDGRNEKRAVKIRAHSLEAPEARVRIWRDNDPSDELAPNVLPRIVYQDEGRGAFPTLEAEHGSLDADRMIGLCNQIPIKGGNVMNAVFDATDLRLWVAYASGDKEAYERPYVFADLGRLDADADGIPDLQAASIGAGAE